MSKLQVIQEVIIAITILTAVPIAGTATAWFTQTNKGNVTLTLQILIITTLFGRFFTPFIFKFFSQFFNGRIRTKTFLITADKGVGSFLIYGELALPAVLGLPYASFIKNKLNSKDFCTAYIKITNLLSLTLLIYVNSSVILPRYIF
ncbi:MAG: hypothetical protein MZU95_03965 [Desulfomicrobium escambiense]|nr:hypothetical protein [Desulfomicrobium escambiense]